MKKVLLKKNSLHKNKEEYKKRIREQGKEIKLIKIYYFIFIVVEINIFFSF